MEPRQGLFREREYCLLITQAGSPSKTTEPNMSQADGPPSAGRPTARSRPGRKQRSRADLAAKGCTPAAIDLILALQDLLNSRYSSQTEFVRSLFGSSNDHQMAATTLSNELSGEGRRRDGPSWEVCHLIVTHCAPSERRLPEMARIAGLFARANDVARPADYKGPVFPVEQNRLDSRSDVDEHLEHITEGLRASWFETSTTCPRRTPRSVLRPWGLPVGNTPLRRATHEIASERSDLGSCLAVVATPVDAPEGFSEQPFPQWVHVPTSVVATRFDAVEKPRRRAFWRRPGTMLRPGESMTIPGTGLGHVAATCLNGYLYLSAQCDAEPDCRPLVEWSITDQRDVLVATGLLFAHGSPFDGGSPYVVPHDGRLCISEGSSANLEGVTVVGIQVQSLTVVLRRLDAGRCPCRVCWSHASVHYHPISSRLVRPRAGVEVPLGNGGYEILP